MTILRLLLIILAVVWMMASSTYVAADEYVDRAIHLDAEMLAEAGIKERYEELLPTLRKYVKNPTQIEERLGAYSDSYAVQAGGRELVVYGKVPDDLFLLWSRATFVFFAIVNDQLSGTDVEFYALYGGNDLEGIFLTKQELEKVRNSAERRQDWPYQPTMEAPWFGQFHEANEKAPWYQSIPEQ